MTAPQLTDGCLVIDNSSLSRVKACAQQAAYALLARRERAVTTAKGRGPGKALHKWLEVLYAGSRGGPVDAAVEAAAGETLASYYADLQLAPGDEYLNLARMQQVAHDYLHGCRVELNGGKLTYQHEGWAGGDMWSVEGVEVPFAVRLGSVFVTWSGEREVPVIYIGRSDLVARLKARGERVCVDHKSARRWTNADINHWRRDSGLLGYVACIPQWVREGVAEMPDRVRTPMIDHEKLRQQLASAGVGETGIQGYAVNAFVIRDVSDLRRCKEAPTSYHREVYWVDQAACDEWRANTLAWCQTWLTWMSQGTFPMNTSSCAHHFGGLCPYYETCSLPPGKQREIMLASDLYQDATWSPIDRTTDD